MAPPSTLVELLVDRATRNADGRGYTFLDDVEGGAAALSYGQLDARARAIGRELSLRVRPGERALLLYPPGLDFIAAFFGALYGGVVAVPAYPPDPTRLSRTLPRLRAVIADARVQIVLTTRPILALAQGLFQAIPELAALQWLATDALASEAPDFEPIPASGPSLAMLQYTSGSTGSPKGVMLCHRNLLANQAMILEGFEHDADGVVVGWLPQYHDMGLIGSILHPLYCGSPAVLMSPQAFLVRPMRWLETIAQYRASTSGGPNFAYELCVRKSTDEECRKLDLSSWKVAFCGAEPVRSDTLRRFRDRFASSGFEAGSFYPCYGLAEATLIVTGHRRSTEIEVRDVDAEALERAAVKPPAHPAAAVRSLVSNGSPLGPSRVVIVGPGTRRRCAEGHVGEVWVAGPHVALGYWENAEATRETFEARIDGDDDGDGDGEDHGPYLRTGDLGFLAGGRLFLVGRLKDLIILRGRNHHPEDLEWTLEGVHAALRPGCSAAFSVPGEAEEELVIVAELGKRVSTAPADVFFAIREAIAAQHEIQPDRIHLVGVGSLPKTSSGKIQRRATRDLLLSGELPLVASWTSANHQRGRAAPSATSPAGGSLVQLVAGMLGLEESALDLDAPLTRYGVDSLSATELLWEAKERLGLELSIGELLGGASLRALASHPRAPVVAEAAPEVPAPASDDREGALSAGEQALWFLHHLAPESSAYHVATALRVHSVLDVPALKAAAEHLVARHPALRTRYPAREGKPTAEPSPEPLDFAVLREDTLHEDTLREEVRRPFDLSRGPLFRVRVLERDGERPVVLLVLHHIVTDFWSLCVMADELVQLYQAVLDGEAPRLPPPPPSYGAHASRQQAFLASPEGDRAFEHWRAVLSPDVPDLDLPTDHPRPPAQTFRGASEPFELDARLSARLEALARRQGVTLYAVLLAAYQVLLSRYTGQTDFAVGVPTAGRRHPFQATAGYFANLVPLRADLVGLPTFEDLARRVQRRLADALEHQEYPFSQLVERLNPSRDPSRSPIFQTVLVLQQANRLAESGLSGLSLGEGGHRARLGPLDVESVALEQRSSQFDLTLSLAHVDQRLAGACEYNTDLFGRSRVARLLGHYETLLRWLVDHPGAPLAEAELLTAAERQLLLGTGTGTGTAPGPVFELLGLHRLVEQQVHRTPDAPAVERGERGLTYRELDARANQLAWRLRRLGVGPEVRVGLCMGRSPELVVAMLGVLKAGGAYVPLDPEAPPQRLAWMIEDAAVGVVLTDLESQPGLPAVSAPLLRLDADWQSIAEESESTLPDIARADNLAYVIYTSGSTGRPKAVMIAHRAVSNYLQATQRDFPLGAGDRCLQLAAISFDASVSEIFTPLVAGAQLVLAAPDEQRDPAKVVARLRDDRITVLQVVPSLLQFLVQEPGLAECVALRLVYCGGEAMSAELATATLARVQITLVNCYGPAEATIDAARLVCGQTAERGIVSVGKAVTNLEVRVLDEELRPVPVGVPGEACIGGVGLARGYLGRPDLTAEKLVPDPYSATPGARLYRSGDRMRLRDDGNLEFLGRIDHQVKLRGARVELGEIESQLAAQDGVGAAAVLVREDVPGHPQLVAYVVPAQGHACDERALRVRLGELLPGYMVPSVFVVLDALPLSPSGKVERGRLPAPARTSPAGFVTPREVTEEIVAGLYARVLGHDAVGALGDFFELGGHSLLATQLTARIREIFQVDLPLRTLFAERTVENVAKAIVAGRARKGGFLLPVQQGATGAVHPQSPAQRRLWFLDQLEPGSPVYLIPATLRLEGELSARALERTLALLLGRHAALRTTFGSQEGAPVQRVSEVLALELPVVDLQHLSDAARTLEVERRARAEAREPFSLSEGPLVRATLLRLRPSEHVLLLTVHHIISDGRSMEILLRDLETVYPAVAAGREPPPRSSALTYQDYTAWQAMLLREVEADQLAYWRRQLEGIPDALALPTDRPVPPVRSSRGAAVRFVLPDPAALESLARAEGASLFMVLLAGFQILLHRVSGEPDIVVGTPVANRTRRELEDIVGCFVNTLVLRARVDDRAGARALLRQVRDMALDAYAHQDLPFERLVEELNPRRNLGHTPLFRVMFALEDAAADVIRLPGISVEALRVDRQVAHFDLSLTLTRIEGRLEGTFEYATDLFDQPRLQRMAEHLVAIYEAIGRDPDAPLHRSAALPPAQARRLLELGRGEPLAPGFAPIHEQLERRALADPDAIALRQGGAVRTYAQLVAQARRWEDRLRAEELGAGSRVGVFVERSLELPSLLLGVWSAGGAIVPLDPEEPPLRLHRMIEDAGLTAMVTTAGLRERLPSAGGWRCLLVEDGGREASRGETGEADGTPPEQLAAVLFMSGPSGRPDPVAVTHGALEAALRGAWSPALDAWLAELLRPLVHGAQVVHDLLPRPGPGVRLYVVDPDGELVPEGAVGELWVGGASLASGHPGRPGLTAERFVPDPFGSEPGARLYRTGDRVQWRADGQLLFHGRRDRRVTLMGAPIEPAEIEAALVEHAHVSRAAVVTMLDPQGQRRAWAYVMLAPAKSVTVDALIAHLRLRLPPAAIPAGFTFFPHGKRDLSRLGPPEGAALARPAMVSPRNDAEARLATMWQELLGRSAIGIHDDFFELGGHSILATQLVSRIRGQWGIELPVRTLFEAPTIAGLAAALQTHVAGKVDRIKPLRSAEDELLERIDELSDEELDRALAQAEDGE